MYRYVYIYVYIYICTETHTPTPQLAAGGIAGALGAVVGSPLFTIRMKKDSKCGVSFFVAVSKRFRFWGETAQA